MSMRPVQTPEMSARRLCTPTLSDTDLRWSWVVWREMNSRSAMSRVSRPSTMSATSSRTLRPWARADEVEDVLHACGVDADGGLPPVPYAASTIARLSSVARMRARGGRSGSSPCSAASSRPAMLQTASEIPSGKEVGAGLRQ